MGSRSFTNYVNAGKSDAALVPAFNRVSKLFPNIASFPSSSLLSLALLFRICKNMESDENTSNRLFTAVCKCLQNLKYLDPSTALLSDLMIKQPHFADAITEFMQQMHHKILNPTHILVPSTRKCLDKKPSVSSIYTYQSSRYSESFDELAVIAEGGFGTVCKARHKVDKAVYAVKKVFFKYKNDAQFEKIIREAKQLAALKHPHIVNYNNAWLDTVDDAGGGNESDSDSSSTTPEESISDLEDNTQNSMYFFPCGMEGISSSPPTDFASLQYEEISEEVSIDVETVTYRSTQHRRHSSGATCSLADFPEVEMSPSETNLPDDGNNNCRNCERMFAQDMKKLTIRATLFIQMEYCDHDLRSWLRLRSNKTGHSIMQQLKPMDIFYQVLSGVEYIHSKSVIHRDLTPNNIFITKEKGIVKIGDFGLACLVHQTQESKVTCSNSSLSSVFGTPPYCAPEQRENHRYDFKVDIYSLGIVLLELLCPCETSMEFSLLVEDVLTGNYPTQLIQKLPDHVVLIEQMTKTNPTERPTATEILNSTLFEQKCVKKRTEDLKDRLLNLSNFNRNLGEVVQSLKQIQSEVLHKCLDENKQLKTANDELKTANNDLKTENERLNKRVEELEWHILWLRLNQNENARK